MHKNLEYSVFHEWLLERQTFLEKDSKGASVIRIRKSSRGPHRGYPENSMKGAALDLQQEEEEDWKEN